MKNPRIKTKVFQIYHPFSFEIVLASMDRRYWRVVPTVDLPLPGVSPDNVQWKSSERIRQSDGSSDWCPHYNYHKQVPVE